MRTPAYIVAIVFTVTACGSTPSDGSADTVPPPPSSTTVPGEAPDDERDARVTGEVDDQAMPETTTSLQNSGPDDDSTSFGGDAPLSIEDALLPDDALPPSWEPQWRQLERTGYGSGPNQTDCDEYWEFDSLLGRDGGEAMWWIDGGNANHHVIRMADEMEILATLLAIGSIAETCPAVTWNEGGSFTTEAFELDNAIGLRFDDAESGEATVILLTTFGDLVSLMHFQLWTRADGTLLELSHDDLVGLSDEMYRRLEGAGPADSPIVTTTTEAPVVVPATNPPEEASGVGELLPSADMLPTGWAFDDLHRYRGGGNDEALVEACPAAGSIDLIDSALLWEAEYSSDSGSDVGVIIGEMENEAAVAAVDQFARIVECDPDFIIPGSTTSGGAVDLVGADRAANLMIEAPELDGARFELFAAAVGSVVIIVTEEIVAADPGSDIVAFAELVVANVGAAR